VPDQGDSSDSQSLDPKILDRKHRGRVLPGAAPPEDRRLEVDRREEGDQLEEDCFQGLPAAPVQSERV